MIARNLRLWRPRLLEVSLETPLSHYWASPLGASTISQFEDQGWEPRTAAPEKLTEGALNQIAKVTTRFDSIV
jgi:hypothetical protein